MARGRPKTTAKKAPRKKATTSVRKSKATAPLSPTAANNDVQYFINTITQLYQFFVQDHQTDSALSGAQRRRLIGAGVRNYGFIEKCLDVARENPALFPANFNITRFALNVHELDVYRQLFWVLEKFTQAASEAMLINADQSFHDALRVYRILQEQTRSGIHGAEPLFRALNRFFQRPRHPEQGGDPTIPELERDFNKIVHGKADGEIVIKNEMPRVSGGTREIIDNVRTGRAAMKGISDIEVKE